jgi:hypothetical protein
MKKALISAATLSALALAASAQAAAIFQDDFNGTVGNTINGTAPDVRPGTETWTAATTTTFVTGDYASMTSASQAAFLSWTPAAGNIYELSVDVIFNTTTGGIATLGFFDNNISTTKAPNTATAINTPWLGLRNTGGALLRDLTGAAGTGFAEQTTASGTTTIKVSDSPLVWKWNTIKLVLDTTATNWTITGYVPNASNVLVQVGTTQTYTGNGGLNAVTSVGFSTISGAVIQYDNFKLETVVPEPTSLALLGLGGLSLIRRRR